MEPFVMMLKHFAQVCLITPSKLSLILRYLDTGVTLGAAGPDQQKKHHQKITCKYKKKLDFFSFYNTYK
ncbi:unnamed protein product [Callosobruchus maculatus]|uniref:Uncharacterized protein n=1 Tax=Callosobruchus maculatus TaxID=64391 RepID=A0A653DGB1_CALMS|nr:unnamed protein product [Callosobruchus maculatus]